MSSRDRTHVPDAHLTEPPRPAVASLVSESYHQNGSWSSEEVLEKKKKNGASFRLLRCVFRLRHDKKKKKIFGNMPVVNAQ